MNRKNHYSRITRLPQVSAEAGGRVRGVPSRCGPHGCCGRGPRLSALEVSHAFWLFDSQGPCGTCFVPIHTCRGLQPETELLEAAPRCTVSGPLFCGRKG